MQWDCLFIEIRMSFYHNWKAKIQKKKNESDAIRTVENQKIREKIIQNRKNAEIIDTETWKKYTIKEILFANTYIFLTKCKKSTQKLIDLTSNVNDKTSKTTKIENNENR